MNFSKKGFYYFRAVAINPKGEVETFHSSNYFIISEKDLIQQKIKYIKYLTTQGNKDIKITHTKYCEDDNFFLYL